MSKITLFLLFNIFVYMIYWGVDKIFTLLDWYSNPKLGEDIMIMPTSSDVWLIFVNVLLSSMLGYYLLYRVKTEYLS